MYLGRIRKKKQSYQYDKLNQRLFTVPDRITDVNSDIVVIDRTSNDGGRVVVLGMKGNVKWIYQGHPQINAEDKPFDPCDIVTTSVGNVIVADRDNHTLHVISGEGELLTYKVMSDQGVILPVSRDHVKYLPVQPPYIEIWLKLTYKAINLTIYLLNR